MRKQFESLRSGGSLWADGPQMPPLALIQERDGAWRTDAYAAGFATTAQGAQRRLIATVRGAG